MFKNSILQWYKDNGIIDVIEEKPFNHFNVPCETISTKQTLPIKIVKENSNIQKSTPIKTEITLENKLKVKTQMNTGEKVEIKATTTSKYKLESNKQEFNFNYIYQNLANKYRNDNIKMMQKNNIGTIEDFIAKSRELSDKANTIDELKEAVENFDGYLDIKKLATNTVFGEGNRNADIMIIGEAPGNNEDLEGRPFCGQSGQLLDEMFKSIGIKREELYITNTLFWRPPGNRTPTDDEINICRPFVEKHIALINPKIIVFMGATALKDLIETNLTITKARKQLFDYTNKYLNGRVIKTTPLFHPSYLLRQPNKKKDVWSDLLFLTSVLNNL